MATCTPHGTMGARATATSSWQHQKTVATPGRPRRSLQGVTTRRSRRSVRMAAAFTYMGDYIANVSDGTHQYFAWGDNRDIVTNFLWPQGRHDPDVFFARQ